MVFLIGCLVVLEGVHFGEIVAARDPRQGVEQRVRVVIAIYILARQCGGVFDFVAATPLGEAEAGQAFADRQAGDQIFDVAH